MGGASSKQTFSELVHALLEKDLDSNDHEFFDELWKTVLPVEDVFEIIPADDMRKMIVERPENVRIIFTQAVAQLYQVIQTPYPIYFQQALNCTRMLCRLLPILLESSGDPFVKELLWSRRLVRSAGNTTESQGQDTAEEKPSTGEELTESTAESKQSTEEYTTKAEKEAEEEEEYQESEPLAVILVNTIYHLLFLPDFTIDDPNVDFSESDVDTPQFKSALMWAPGIGSAEKAVVASSQFDTTRVEILRLLIAMFGDSLFQSADHYDSCASLWLEVATSVDAPYAEIVFYSLINTVLGYDPIGWGVPYGNLMATDTAKSVMETSIQALLILLDYGHPIKYNSNSAALGNLPFVLPADTQIQGFNVFRRFLGQIEDHDQLNFLFRGFVRLLSNVPQSESTYLPYSVTRISIEQELLVLLWKCLEETPAFMPYILKHCDVNELLVPICYFLLEARKDASKVGLIYLCTFTLLKLSGERSFGVALNKAYQLQLPVDVPLFSGNHADLLVIVLQKMIVSGTDKLSPLYSCFLTIICNVSPYSKSLCTVSAMKLINLFQLFVSPRFLYAAEGNHVYVSLLLETFNNILQYQYEGNGQLVFGIVRRRELFEGLANLTVPGAIRHATELDAKRRLAKGSNGKQAQQKNGTTSSQSTQNEAKTATTTEQLPSPKRFDEEGHEVFAEAQPTSLISTQNLERRVAETGEVEDVRSSTADSRANTALNSPNRTTASSEAANTDKSTADEQAAKVTAPQPPLSPPPNMRFVPSEDWLRAVKSELPLNTILRLLKNLVPQIEELSSKSAVDEQQVVDFLKSTTLVGLLPVPHPIVIRKYQPNRHTNLWFTAFLWGVIFMHNQSLPLFDGKHVKLFVVQNI